MSEKSEKSTVNTSQTIVESKSSKEMIAVCGEITRTVNHGKNADYQTSLSTTYKFKNYKSNTINDMLRHVSEEGYTIYKYFDNGIVESSACNVEKHKVTYYETVIVALYQK